MIFAPTDTGNAESPSFDTSCQGSFSVLRSKDFPLVQPLEETDSVLHAVLFT